MKETSAESQNFFIEFVRIRKELCALSESKTYSLEEAMRLTFDDWDKKKVERFKMPNAKEMLDIAIVFNEGKLDEDKLADMIAYCEFILDRLYENGRINEPTLKEKAEREANKYCDNCHSNKLCDSEGRCLREPE